MRYRSLALVLFAFVSTAGAAGSTLTVLDVHGMDCATCPITVKTILKKQPGVEEVKVDFGKATAEVRFDPEKVSQERLAQAVTEGGFPSAPRK